MKGKNNPRYKTGLCMPGAYHRPIYNSWQNMKSRCLRKSHPKYHRYGGRGIKICPEWIDIQGFYEWSLENGWQPGLTLDRIDNNGDYSPSNCRWVSVSENSRDKSTTKITFEQAKHIRERAANGECEKELAEEHGVVHGTIWFIVNNFTHVEEGKCTRKIKQRNQKNDQENSNRRSSRRCP